jgi:hypothetical protein
MFGMNTVEKNKTPFYVQYTFFVRFAVLEIINLCAAEPIMLQARLNMRLDVLYYPSGGV